MSVVKDLEVLDDNVIVVGQHPATHHYSFTWRKKKMIRQIEMDTFERKVIYDTLKRFKLTLCRSGSRYRAVMNVMKKMEKFINDDKD